MQTRPHWSFRAMYEILSWLSRYQPIIGRRSWIESIMWSSMVTMVTLPTRVNPGLQEKGIKKKRCLLAYIKAYLLAYIKAHLLVESILGFVLSSVSSSTRAWLEPSIQRPSTDNAWNHKKLFVDYVLHIGETLNVDLPFLNLRVRIFKLFKWRLTDAFSISFLRYWLNERIYLWGV